MRAGGPWGFSGHMVHACGDACGNTAEHDNAANDDAFCGSIAGGIHIREKKMSDGHTKVRVFIAGGGGPPS
jgi:hypothetical protein